MYDWKLLDYDFRPLHSWFKTSIASSQFHQAGTLPRSSQAHLCLES
jgi:hypothetical protein